MNILIETQRLFLKELEHSDSTDLFEMDADPDVHLFLENKPVKSMDEITTIIENYCCPRKSKKFNNFLCNPLWVSKVKGKCNMGGVGFIVCYWAGLFFSSDSFLFVSNNDCR